MAYHLQFHLRAQPNELREYLVMILCNMYTFIHHEGSTVYIQSKTDRKLLLQTDKTHTHLSSPLFGHQ